MTPVNMSDPGGKEMRYKIFNSIKRMNMMVDMPGGMQ